MRLARQRVTAIRPPVSTSQLMCAITSSFGFLFVKFFSFLKFTPSLSVEGGDASDYTGWGGQTSAFRPAGAGVTGGCQCLERDSNSGPLQEPQAPFTTNAPLQAMPVVFMLVLWEDSGLHTDVTNTFPAKPFPSHNSYLLLHRAGKHSSL